MVHSVLPRAKVISAVKEEVVSCVHQVCGTGMLKKPVQYQSMAGAAECCWQQSRLQRHMAGLTEHHPRFINSGSALCESS